MDIEIKEIVTQSAKKVVGTQINQSMYDRLKEDSEKDFMSISDLLRKIIYLYYKNIDTNEKENN